MRTFLQLAFLAVILNLVEMTSLSRRELRQIELMSVESTKKICNSQKPGRDKKTFYFTFPTSNKLYVQCDLNGKGFLRACPKNTVFTSNLACEQDQPSAQKRAVKHTKPLLTILSGLNNNQSSPIAKRQAGPDSITNEWFGQSPEYDYLCAGKTELMNEMVFYMPHPTEKETYIQCDRDGKASLRYCQIDEHFTENLICEKGKIDKI